MSTSLLVCRAEDYISRESAWRKDPGSPGWAPELESAQTQRLRGEQYTLPSALLPAGSSVTGKRGGDEHHPRP